MSITDVMDLHDACNIIGDMQAQARELARQDDEEETDLPKVLK